MKQRSLSDLQQRALAKLEHRALVLGSLASELDATRAATLGALAKLADRGLVECTDGHWHRAA